MISYFFFNFSPLYKSFPQSLGPFFSHSRSEQFLKQNTIPCYCRLNFVENSFEIPEEGFTSLGLIIRAYLSVKSYLFTYFSITQIPLKIGISHTCVPSLIQSWKNNALFLTETFLWVKNITWNQSFFVATKN